MQQNYVIGIDYGTDTVRALIIDASNGTEIATSVYFYPRWEKDDYCDPVNNQFRQHPLDYIEGLQEAITSALSKVPKKVKTNIKGISVDTTGSTPCAVDSQGIPLALKAEFKDNPNAMFLLWKDHTAVLEAEEINHAARTWGGEDYTKYSGGVYSSEWFWAKILHTLRKDSKVCENAFSWIEHCDWIPALLTGCTDVMKVKRSRCAAGHKAMWHTSFNGLPKEDFLTTLDPLLKGLRNRLYDTTFTSNKAMGFLSNEWAKQLGLDSNVTVGVGAFDAHMGAVGGGIKPYALCKVMGTSTCDMLVAPLKDIGDKLIKGICGQVPGSIIPGMMGMEAGQSAFGDIYAWFKQILLWPFEYIFPVTNKSQELLKQELMVKIDETIIPELSNQASKIPIDEKSIIALDWMNGRRTPYANQLLKGALTGLHLGSSAPHIFRALVEGTAFGAKKIVDRFEEEGIAIKEVIALGGIPKKAPFIMQVVSDILGKKIKVTRSEQACALGAGMFAATAAGIYKTIQEAQAAMESGFEKEYIPNKGNTSKYRALYNNYSVLGRFIENQTQKVCRDE